MEADMNLIPSIFAYRAVLAAGLMVACSAAANAAVIAPCAAREGGANHMEADMNLIPSIFAYRAVLAAGLMVACSAAANAAVIAQDCGRLDRMRSPSPTM